MAPYEFRVALEPAGHPGCIYHVRVWVRRTVHEERGDAWMCVLERQIDVGEFPGEPRKQWRRILAEL